MQSRLQAQHMQPNDHQKDADGCGLGDFGEQAEVNGVQWAFWGWRRCMKMEPVCNACNTGSLLWDLLGEDTMSMDDV